MSPVDGQNILLDKNNDNGFELDELTEQFEDINEKDLKFSANFELPLVKGKYSNKLKFGAKVVDKNKDMWIDFYEYSPTDEDAFIADAFGHLKNENRDGYMGGDRYQVGNFVEKEYVGGLNLTDANKFEQEIKYDEMCENCDAHETVSAGYIRFDPPRLRLRRRQGER